MHKLRQPPACSFSNSYLDRPKAFQLQVPCLLDLCRRDGKPADPPLLCVSLQCRRHQVCRLDDILTAAHLCHRLYNISSGCAAIITFLAHFCCLCFLCFSQPCVYVINCILAADEAIKILLDLSRSRNRSVGLERSQDNVHHAEYQQRDRALVIAGQMSVQLAHQSFQLACALRHLIVEVVPPAEQFIQRCILRTAEASQNQTKGKM